MTRIKGVDISVYQKGISFSALKKAGVDFAIIRAGYGEKKDTAMDKFVEDCKTNGIDFGFYWYSYAMSVKQAEAEAEKCAAVLKGLSPTYPVFYDMEEKKQINELNTDTRTKMAIAFCEKIKQAGFKPGKIRRDCELRIFIEELKKAPLVTEEWDSELWNCLLDKAIIFRDNHITFRFRNGTEITITIQNGVV